MKGKSVEKLGYKQGLPFPKASLKLCLITADNEFQEFSYKSNLIGINSE